MACFMVSEREETLVAFCVGQYIFRPNEKHRLRTERICDIVCAYVPRIEKSKHHSYCKNVVILMAYSHDVGTWVLRRARKG